MTLINMELDLLSEEWSEALEISNPESNFVVAKSNRKSHIELYKNNSKADDQKRRWLQKLNDIRSKNKSDKFDKNRENFDNLEFPNKNPWSSEKSTCITKSWRSFSNYLMLAEWLLFMPTEFQSHYLMKLCPKGRHVFVRAEKGVTKIYSRKGRLLESVNSRLPGGGLDQSDRQNSLYITLLDCIMFQPASDVNLESDQPMKLYVLDMMYYRGTSYYNMQFRERTTWLENHWCSQIENYQEDDKIKFEVVPSCECDLESMKSVLESKPPYEVDGVLFYHGDVDYEPGATPLVGWLKPYMLPDWFKEISVHADFMSDIPEDYKNYIDDIRSYETSKCEQR